MSSIYELHDKAFRHVSAYVILLNGERVATVAIKFPADGAGRLYAYVHWIGTPMVRGFAGGYGYDKRSAACADAATGDAARGRAAVRTRASRRDRTPAPDLETGGLQRGSPGRESRNRLVSSRAANRRLSSR